MLAGGGVVGERYLNVDYLEKNAVVVVMGVPKNGAPSALRRDEPRALRTIIGVCLDANLAS